MEKVEEVDNLGKIDSILTWDQEVMMPERGIEARSKQKAVMSRLKHRLISDEELGQLIKELEDQDLTGEQDAVLREIKREHEKEKKIPVELLEKISEKESECVEKWKNAREESDFSMVAPHLEELVELKRRYAEAIDPDEEPYRVLFRDYEPYIEFETMVLIMEKLEKRVPEILEKIRESDAEVDTEAFKGDFPEEKQRELNEELVEKLNFDWRRGRLDVSEHPFTLGNQFDCRITTRFNGENLAESILPTVHEFGHGMYQLGLDQDNYGNPLGSARDLSIHESQSRLWENHIARSRAFWEQFLPTLKEHFPSFNEVSAEECYESVNQVDPENMIRVNADEVSYHLHIALRFELERRLVNGEIEVEELPDLWNDKMEELLDIRPGSDAEGVLQDIHWYWGSIGYFPTYSLGSVLAAQIYREAEEEIADLDEKISNGEFEELQEWLRENIHIHGKKFKTAELVEKVTGQKPSAEPFLDYIEEKYGELYDL